MKEQAAERLWMWTLGASFFILLSLWWYQPDLPEWTAGPGSILGYIWVAIVLTVILGLFCFATYKASRLIAPELGPIFTTSSIVLLFVFMFWIARNSETAFYALFWAWLIGLFIAWNYIERQKLGS